VETELTAWLRKQIDEDERAARAWLPLGNPTAADREHVARQDPARALAEVDAKRRILNDRQEELDRHKTYLDRPDTELHADMIHPEWEYTVTEGPRKQWMDEDTPPDGEGWERNVDAGDNGWERFDYHEEAYWRRRRPEGGGYRPAVPRHILHLAAVYADRPGWREEWRL